VTEPQREGGPLAVEGVGKVTDEAECRAQPSGCAAISVRLKSNVPEG